MFSTRAKEYVEALYASRSHVELTVGVLKDGLTQVKHFGPDGKEQEKKLIYPVGSIGKTITAALLAKRVEEGRIGKVNNSTDAKAPKIIIKQLF